MGHEELIIHGTDINLYFDATHLRDNTPDKVAGLVLMLDKPGGERGFEDTLSYVRLPVLSYTSDNPIGPNPSSNANEANERRQRESGGQDNKLMGRNSVVTVFDKLAEVGVRSIVQLTVEEDQKSPPHSDSAIERAIRGEDSRNPENKRKDRVQSLWRLGMHRIRIHESDHEIASERTLIILTFFRD